MAKVKAVVQAIRVAQLKQQSKRIAELERTVAQLTDRNTLLERRFETALTALVGREVFRYE